VPTSSIEVYVAAFIARCDASGRSEGQVVIGRSAGGVVDEPGLHGVVSSSADSPTRLLVTDDRAHDALAALLADACTGTITVFAAAPRCTEILTHRRGWQPKAVTAMINRDLRSVPEEPLPTGLTLRSVRRADDDPSGDVPQNDAVAAVLLANPSSDDDPDRLANHLRSLPPTTHLFAAVDDAGAVRATSGFGTFGTYATVFFVNTDPGWRRRGIGRVMTATAMRSACHAGASQAGLDGADAAIAIYRQLGFEIAARATQFFRTD
jgi:ribosomal protein S18 acetylase RimI-like enzyme